MYSIPTLLKYYCIQYTNTVKILLYTAYKHCYNITVFRVIMQRTNTVIIFPDAGDPNIPPIRNQAMSKEIITYAIK